MSNRDSRIEEIIKQEAGKFLLEEAGKASLVTVTKVMLSPDGKNATIFITAFPENKEKTALEFAKRKLSDFRERVKSETRLARIPFFDFALDAGEKNRQLIDELSQEAEQQGDAK